MKWLLLIPAILVSSCSSPSNNKIENKQEEKTIVENLESKAKRQMMATIKELANNPSSVSISKFEKEFDRLLTETIENLKKLAEEFRKMSEMMGGNVWR